MVTYIVRYQSKNNSSQIDWGIVKNNSIFPLNIDSKTLGSLLTNELSKVISFRNNIEEEKSIPLSSIEILSPVTPEAKILCQALNYKDHALETGINTDQISFNTIFHKAASSIAPANTDIVRPKGVKLLDYELELGLVIKKRISQPVKITNNNISDYLAGIVMVNDISARDIQVPQLQWFKGKSFRTFCPCGPYLALLEPEDIPLLDDMELTLEVNGQVRQKGNTQALIFKPAETLTELSSILDLNPGDMIITGTPSGVAVQAPGSFIQWISKIIFSEKKRMEIFIKMQAKSGRYLNDGDKISSRIESSDKSIYLGVQENRIVTPS